MSESVMVLSKLVQHYVWANAAWIEFLAAQSTPDDYCIQRMSHILHGERAWFQRIAGQDPDREIWHTLNVTELRDMLSNHERTYSALLRGDLQRVIAYTRFTGERYASPIADILAHLVTHGAHHRGQLTAHVAKAGLKPVNTDFIQFCLANGL